MKKLHDYAETIKYRVIVPDGAGSFGDEAMIAGLLNLLQGERAMLLTPSERFWQCEMLGQTHLFDERFTPDEKLSEEVTVPCRLIVVGADTLDGTCGYEAAHYRLAAVKVASESGNDVFVFCSVRSDTVFRCSMPTNVR